jgi:hypothetical protein
MSCPILLLLVTLAFLRIPLINNVIPLRINMRMACKPLENVCIFCLLSMMHVLVVRCNISCHRVLSIICSVPWTYMYTYTLHKYIHDTPIFVTVFPCTSCIKLRFFPARNLSSHMYLLLRSLYAKLFTYVESRRKLGAV